jgi:hypothetical protein
LRHLAALASIAQEASFSGAAESLGYVKSAVSQQIGSLERIVGQRLVNRSVRPRSVTVTDAHERLSVLHARSAITSGAARVPRRMKGYGSPVRDSRCCSQDRAVSERTGSGRCASCAPGAAARPGSTTTPHAVATRVG